jgi:broad specificity phosphatase PhoE
MFKFTYKAYRRRTARMKVTFLRHARSIFNELNTSEKDCELSEFGKAQAADLSGNFDVVICSFMTRTRQTLALSKIQYKELYSSELCREFKTTICDYTKAEDEIPETRESLAARAAEFCKYLKETFEGRNVLVVSHGDFIFHLNGGTKYPDNAEFQVIDI